MALAQLPGFIGPSYTHKSVNVAADRTVNLYPEITESGTGKNGEVMSLVGTPGLTWFSTVAANGGIASVCRGAYTASNGNAYFVLGNRVFVITDVTLTLNLASGNLGTSTGPVSMTDNGTSVVIVDGSKGYTCLMSNVTAAPTEISDADFPDGATTCDFLDGYVVVNKPSTNQFYISALSDATSWDALDFSSKEGRQDRLIAVKCDHRELVLFGAQTTEIWQNTGNPNFPFERAYFFEHGCVAPHSIQKLDNSMFWIGKDIEGQGIAYRLNGYQPQRISTHPIELLLSQSSNLAGATTWSYQDKGHSFYCLNAPGLSSTLCLDAATGLWHERTFTNINGGEGRHRAQGHAFISGLHLVGDYEDGTIYKLLDTTYVDQRASSGADHPITRRRRMPHLADKGNRLTCYKFRLDAETGVGLQVASGTSGYDPQMMFRYYKDGGHTFGNEIWRSMGKIGEYLTRMEWNRAAFGRDLVFEVICTEPVKQAWISAMADIRVASS